ncbi:site-specific integrase [Rhizobium leguminosarum]|uniref:site-specific integrase n=1 Tax=Rhizobium leguminosarum TaxID=384 RepID=UPI001C95CF72|nr:site-specific integrase [Rhizobium leguminosarum]MBY5751411.1 phage integrase family protein [Rhizobium leguminosarum]
MIDRSRYEARLTARTVPSAVIATRPYTPAGKRPKGGWSRGKHRSLLHNCWLIATSDPSKKRKDVEHIVSFDAAVDFPCRFLSDESLLGDRLTKKILVLSCITVGPRENGILDATFTAQIARKFDWVLRYRLAEGYESFAEIPEFFASDLSKRLSTGGTLALVPISDRLDSLLAEQGGAADGSLVVDRGFASNLGVTTAALSRSAEFQLALIDAAPYASIEPDLEGDQDEPDAELKPDLDADDLPRRLASDLKAARNLKNYLEILEFLFRLSDRDLEHDRMEHDPFEYLSIDALVNRDGEEKGRTATLLPADMMRALTTAAKFATTYSDYILATFRDARSFAVQGVRAIEVASTRKLRPVGGTTILPIWNRGSGSRESLPPKTILLGEAIRHLFASTAILIAGFAARRDIGVRSAHAGCITEDASGLATMLVYIGKTDKDRVAIPVPSILKTVVKTLEDLSADTREANGTEWIFEVAFDLADPTRLVSSRFHQIIDEFLEFAGAPPPEGQDRWDLSIHMLRRGYGIWYFFGLTGGSTDALSMMYRHNDPNMTRIYFTMILPGEINQLKSELDARLRSSTINRTPEDQEWIDHAYGRLSYLKAHQQAFDEPKCEVFVEKLLGLWRGTETVIGEGGKALFNDVQAIAERAMATVRIGSRANSPDAMDTPLLQRLIKYAKEHFLEPVIGSNMWCTANPRDAQHLKDARCLNLKDRGKAPWKRDGQPEDLMPDFDFACNRVCIGCKFGAAFQDGQQSLSEEVRQRYHAARHAATASLEYSGDDLLAELEADIAAAGPVKKGRPQ